MKGFTTYLIDAATNDNCKIFSYDINFENKFLILKKAQYFNFDISRQSSISQKQKILLPCGMIIPHNYKD